MSIGTSKVYIPDGVTPLAVAGSLRPRAPSSEPGVRQVEIDAYETRSSFLCPRSCMKTPSSTCRAICCQIADAACKGEPRVCGLVTARANRLVPAHSGGLRRCYRQSGWQ